jgi:hypothetical protein
MYKNLFAILVINEVLETVGKPFAPKIVDTV